MAIAKRPKTTETSTSEMMDEQERERREQEFLASAPDVASKGQVEAKPKRQKMQTVHLRFEPDLLPRIEAAAKESGHDDRSAWIRYVVKQALKDLETAK
jgi:hypothetical protein